VTEFGYTLMGEQAPPTQLVDDAIRAERVGFDFAVVSDHYNPWVKEQGHSPYAWSVLGAAAYTTSRIGLMSFVTCRTGCRSASRCPARRRASWPASMPTR
jgi:alkanesulfonate monooxygenase SsuD/methylene tetrahydromethanopterin reductase-like flavin-dependent oxidoreductase (luciferase family)